MPETYFGLPANAEVWKASVTKRKNSCVSSCFEVLKPFLISIKFVSLVYTQMQVYSRRRFLCTSLGS